MLSLFKAKIGRVLSVFGLLALWGSPASAVTVVRNQGIDILADGTQSQVAFYATSNDGEVLDNGKLLQQGEHLTISLDLRSLLAAYTSITSGELFVDSTSYRSSLSSSNVSIGSTSLGALANNSAISSPRTQIPVVTGGRANAATLDEDNSFFSLDSALISQMRTAPIQIVIANTSLLGGSIGLGFRVDGINLQFIGDQPPVFQTVPEPSALGLGLLGLVGSGTMLRRRRPTA